MSSVRILAPAKVNLGLAILGKRPDGYHEIDTIMAMIDLCDEIIISQRDDGDISIGGMDEIPVESNLMTKAARVWSNSAGVEPGWHIEIEKRIPSPAGIGGGSSDAAAVLSALNALHDHPLSDRQMFELAASIGSDCPFFLFGSGARATGIGTELRDLPVPSGWLTLAIPPAADTAKTATLYGALTPEDYGTSAAIDVIEQWIDDGDVFDHTMPNSFLRPVMTAFPTLPRLYSLMSEMTGTVSLSGAGPALYAITGTKNQADRWARELSAQVTNDTATISAAFLQKRPQPEIVT